MNKPKRKKQRVLCVFCGKPIHIKHFAGVFRGEDEKDSFFCDSLPCLLEFNREKEIVNE